jgi:tetratricopeptide (TPR) repeat protein
MRFLKIWLILALACLAGLLTFSKEMQRVMTAEMWREHYPILPMTFDGIQERWQIPVGHVSWIRQFSDWREAWGAAELESFTDTTKALADFRRAIELNPTSREPRCRFVMSLALDIVLDRREGSAYQGPPVSEGDWKPLLPDPANVAAALSELDGARHVDPDNGLLDCTSAYVLFAARRDSEAMEALGRAITKPRWEDYTAAAARAAAYAGRQLGWARYFAAMTGYRSAREQSLAVYARRMPRWLVAWGRELEQHGQHQEATLRYRLAFLALDRMRASAHTEIALLLVANATLRGAEVAGALRASEGDLNAVEYDAPWPGRKRVVDFHVRNELGRERFYSYLSAHGADDLALRVRADVAASTDSLNQIRRKGREIALKPEPPLSYKIPLAFSEEAQALLLSCLTALAVLAWLSWVAQRPLWGRRLTWGTVAYLGASAVVSVLVLEYAAPPEYKTFTWPLWILAAAACANWTALSRRPMTGATGRRRPLFQWAANIVSTLCLAILAFAAFLFLGTPRVTLLGVPLCIAVLVACAISTAFSRRRRACARGRRWFLLHWLGNVNVTSLCAIAVLLTLFLLLFIPISIYGARLEHYYQEILTRGELAVLLGK